MCLQASPSVCLPLPVSPTLSLSSLVVPPLESRPNLPTCLRRATDLLPLFNCFLNVCRCVCRSSLPLPTSLSFLPGLPLISLAPCSAGVSLCLPPSLFCRSPALPRTLSFLQACKQIRDTSESHWSYEIRFTTNHDLLINNDACVGAQWPATIWLPHCRTLCATRVSMWMAYGTPSNLMPNRSCF